MASRISSRQCRRVSFAGSGCYSRCGYRGSEGKYLVLDAAQAGVQFLWSSHRRFFQDRACGTQNVSYKGIGVTATHFPVCVMNGASFFNRVLPRTRIALFGANVSIELDWVFRKLVRLLGFWTGRFRGRLSCCVRPWPFCDGMLSRVGLWPFCVLHVFPCWTSPF